MLLLLCLFTTISLSVFLFSDFPFVIWLINIFGNIHPLLKKKSLTRLPLTPKPLCAFLLLTLSLNPPYILKPSGPLGLSSTKALTSSNSTLNGSFPFLLQQYLAPFEDMDFAADVDGDGSFLSYNPHTVYWLEDLVFVLHYSSPPSLSRKPLSCHFPVRLCHPWPLLKITCFPLCPYWFSAC